MHFLSGQGGYHSPEAARQPHSSINFMLLIMPDKPALPESPKKPAVTAAMERPSKSSIKRDMRALTAMGREMVSLPPAQLEQLNLDGALLEAILLAQRIHSRPGHKRQVQYVGKLLRQADAEALRLRLDQLAGEPDPWLHRLEALRDELLADDDCLTQLMDTHPEIDAQALRSCIRAARKEASDNARLAPGQTPARRHYRALFRLLKLEITETPHGRQT